MTATPIMYSPPCLDRVTAESLGRDLVRACHTDPLLLQRLPDGLADQVAGLPVKADTPAGYVTFGEVIA